MKTLALFAALLAWSCAPRAIPVTGIPTAPPKAVPVAPLAQTAARSASATGAVSAKLESQVETLQKSTAGLREGIAASVAEADRLRLQRTASEKEIDALWKMLAGHEQQARDLFTEAEAARETANQQRDLRLKLERDLADVVSKANARDSEADSLRLQRDDLATAAQNAGIERERLQKELTQAEKKAAVGSYLQRWVLGGAIALFAIAAICALLKFYRPVPFVG